MPSSSQKRFGEVKPKRHRGQNFLIDKNILRKIVQAAAIKPEEIIVEIGAGMGVLTLALAPFAKNVIAVELDKGLIPILVDAVAGQQNIRIIQDNALEVPLARYGTRNGSYAVVANIPYNITSRLIRKFLEEHPRPSRMILLIQREVAERMRAKPPNMNLLALSVQYYANIEVLFTVSRHCFSPKPSVESAVIRLTPRPTTLAPDEERRLFLLMAAAFKGKRKRLVSTFAACTSMTKKEVETLFLREKISLTARPQELSLEQWIQLSTLPHSQNTR